ncbi:hypothetical protein BC826DRAFT_738520 [Russula brevipes]|nr:hypothetical protein BC826DRAFT_738520 [Russula brevipes]
MVNFRDPSVIAQDFFALVKLWHAMDGLFIWEFVTTVSYEWSIIRGRRPYRWTIWIYLITRLAALATVIHNIVALNVMTSVNCQASIVTQLIFSYLCLASASLLIVLRIIAIWNKNKVVAAIAIVVWCTNISFLIQGVFFRAGWVPEQGRCAILKIESIRLSAIVALVTDVILFLIMLRGLMLLRRRGGTLAVGRLLWKQGVIWFLLATLAQILPTVFICLDLNDPLDLMFQSPCLITMSIAATRMHRTLVDFLSSNIAHETPPNGGRTFPKAMDTPAVLQALYG